MSEPGQRSARAQGACTCRTGQSKTFFRYKEISLVTYPLATELRSCPRQDDCDLVLIWLTQLSRPVCDKYCETLLASITDSNAPFCRCSRDLRCRRRGFLRPVGLHGYRRRPARKNPGSCFPAPVPYRWNGWISEGDLLGGGRWDSREGSGAGPQVSVRLASVVVYTHVPSVPGDCAA
jgi:hypothetical protein